METGDSFQQAGSSVNVTARNTLSAFGGFVVGSVINFGLITVGMSVIPTPDGVDLSTMDAVRAAMKELPPKNFLFPFLGHAIGTLAGAFIAAKLAASHRKPIALGIGAFFFLGGFMMIFNCGGPGWFIAADLLLAYLPMAYVGGYLAGDA